MLRIIEANSSDLVVSEVINELWRNFNENDSNENYGESGSQVDSASNYANQYPGSNVVFRSDRVSKGGGDGRNYGNRPDSIDL